MSGGAREFRLPDLGEGLTEAAIVRWLVEVGDTVVVDQPAVELETAKAQVEVGCPYAGTVTARYGAEGEEVPVGSPLIEVSADVPAATGAPAPAPAATAAPAPVAVTATGGAAAAGSGNVLVGYGTSEEIRTTSGRARRRLRVRGGARGAPPSAPAQPADRVAPPGGGPVPVISPLVRRLAREHGLDLRQVHGSGPDGLILRADVTRAVGQGQPATAPTTAPVSASAVGTGTGIAPVTSAATARPAEAEQDAPRRQPGIPLGEGPSAQPLRTPLRGAAGVAAEKFTRSRREIPDATCWVDADATGLLDARRAMGEPRVSLAALFARITTAALLRHPQLNATVDQEAREVVQLPSVHLGFAAQTERGLVVPVVRDAHALGTEGLHEEMRRLTAKARQGALTPAELTGSTFTLNNYGVFGVDGSTPILNHPEAGMLGIGRVVEKPWAHRGELALRRVVQLSFTFDHRVCDGGTAGGFLRYVADCVERPALLLRAL